MSGRKPKHPHHLKVSPRGPTNRETHDGQLERKGKLKLAN